ncbi:MAG: hypothetical protein ACYDAK_04270 [Candidatus Limnocylindrales bacterium]
MQIVSVPERQRRRAMAPFVLAVIWSVAVIGSSRVAFHGWTACLGFGRTFPISRVAPIVSRVAPIVSRVAPIVSRVAPIVDPLVKTRAAGGGRAHA